MPPFAQEFAIHRDRELSANSSREGQQNQCVVHESDVIADDYQSLAHVTQVSLTPNCGASEDSRDWKHNQIKQHDTQPTDGPALLPARVGILPGPFLLAFTN